MGNRAPDIGPDQNPSSTQGGAPAGPWISKELPSVPVQGGAPANYGGFRPDNSQPPLPPPGSNDGEQKAPRGNPGR